MSGNLFDRYFTYVERTEPPLVFHRWSILSALGAMLGRQYYLPFGDFNIFPNLYVMLIGDPGTRKSTAIKLSRKALGTTGYDKFAAEKTSKEKFLLDLEGVVKDDAVLDQNKVMQEIFGDEAALGDPKEVFIVADEFNDFVGSGNLDFLSLLGSLWDWDNPNDTYKQRLKNSRSVSIFQPTVSLLSGNTHAGFAEAIPPQALGQGFLSRLLLVFGESSGKKIAFPERPSDEVKSAVTEYLATIKSNVHGEAKLSKKAYDMLTVIYNSYKGMTDIRFQHYSTRRHTHLLKLCMLMAAANCRTEIGAHDVLFANTLLTFTEHRMPRALGEFGKAKNSAVAERIVAALSEATKPLELEELWVICAGSSDLERIDDMLKLLVGLLQAKKIQYVPRSKAGNSPTGYMIVRKQLSSNTLYVDYSLLQETKEN